MIPSKSRFVELREYTADIPDFQVVEKPLRKLGKGEVLVKIAASPINPSDLSFLRGEYGIKKKLPCVPGFEASGTVIASGGGFYANYLKGRNVACTAPSTGDGTWAEYMIASANGCIPLSKKIDLEQGSMSIVNPLTALSLIDGALRMGAKGIVQTAAAGALGQMIHRLAARHSLAVIDIVRRQNQKTALEGQGFTNVLISEDSNFEAKLRALAKKLNTTVAFDAVGGEMTNSLASCIPNKSHVIVYGGLAGAPCSVTPGALIFQNQTIEGFWLSSYLAQKGPISILRLSRKVQKLMQSELKSEIRQRFGLDQAAQAVREYSQSMSGGKILITP